MAIAHEDHSLTLREMMGGSHAPAGPLKVHSASVSIMKFNGDGSELASGDTSGQLILWAVEGGIPTAILPHTSGIKSLAYNEVLGPSHRQVAAGLQDGRVWVWSITAREDPPRAIEGHTR